MELTDRDRFDYCTVVGHPGAFIGEFSLSLTSVYSTTIEQYSATRACATPLALQERIGYRRQGILEIEALE